jgi:hypothetical protein
MVNCNAFGSKTSYRHRSRPIYSGICPKVLPNKSIQHLSARAVFRPRLQLIPPYHKSYTLSVKLKDFTVWRHTWRKNWVNCAALTGSSAGLRTVLSSRLSHRELRSSLRESHSFLNLPADTTMASSQGTSVSSNSFSRSALLTPHFTRSFLLSG